MRISTERLEIIACSAEVARALARGDIDVALLGAQVPEGWPTQEMQGFLPLYAEQLEADPSLLGWGIWLMVRRAEGTGRCASLRSGRSRGASLRSGRSRGASLHSGRSRGASLHSRMVIGDLGFKGKPNRRGTVEIGYRVAPAYRRQGYASEATRALVDWALAQGGVERITAECNPDNVGSIRVLEKLGMRRLESDGVLLRWELRAVGG